MKTNHRIHYFIILSLVFLFVSCKQTTKVCLLNVIENAGGAKATFLYNDDDRIVEFISYDQDGYLSNSYKFYYNANNQIDQIDWLNSYSFIMVRFLVAYNFNGSIGDVYWLHDPNVLGNPINLLEHAKFIYTPTGELDSLHRYNNNDSLLQSYDLLYVDGNLMYCKDLVANTENYFTYDNHPSGYMAVKDFYKLIAPSSPYSSMNNCVKEEIYQGGVLITTINHTFTYNSDGLVSSFDDNQNIYDCTDIEQ